jgi:hypothetical protein
VYSNDIDKRARWQEMVCWAEANGCTHLTDVPSARFHKTAHPTAHKMGPAGGPLYRTWNFEEKQRPSTPEVAAALEALRADWDAIAGPELAEATEPLRFTGAKQRRLVVAARAGHRPPWGGWTWRSKSPTIRRAFTDFRRAINEAISPLEIDHVGFSVAEPLPAEAPAADGDALGPQYGGDNGFTAQMRLHQSRYRLERLGVPCGTGPGRASTRRYGNMLRPEDAERGCNFLSPQIFAVAQERLAQDSDRVEPFRLLHNMLSSQPMCFNLVGPLVRDHALASRLLSATLNEPVEVVDVRVEFSPTPAAEHLADRTSFDAYIEYVGERGRGFVGVETKLTEPFSQKAYDRPEYRRWMRPGGPWRDPHSPRVADIAHNQLWRDHLLAIALRDRQGSPFARGTLLLVSHPGDPACRRVTAGYAELLTPGDDTFVDWPLDRLLETWEAAAPEQQAWLQAFRERYEVVGA